MPSEPAEIVMATRSTRPGRPSLEALALILMSGVLFAGSPASVHLRLLNLAYHSEAWERHAEGFSQVLATYGAGLLVLAIVSYACSMRGVTLMCLSTGHSKRALSVLREEVVPSVSHCFASRIDSGSLLLAMVIGVGVRSYFLAQPMRYDESVTFLNFANKGFLDLFYYPYPNNHVLHTILLRVSTLMWGAHPASIRLPAFLSGIALIPLIFCLCRRLGHSGVLASVAAAVFPYLVSYSTNARGYTLLILLSLLLALVGTEVAKRPSVGSAIVVSSIAAMGMMTMPTMLFPIAATYCWLTCLLLVMGYTLRNTLTGFVLPCSVVTLAFTFVLYTPVILVSDGVAPIVANRFVQAQPWPEFLSQLYPHVRSLGDYCRDIPAALILAGIALAVVGLYRSIRKRDWPTLLILPTMLLGSAIVFLVGHRIPFVRTWIYLVPFVLIMADAGFTWIVDKSSQRIRGLITTVVLIGGAVAAVSLVSTGAIARYEDTGFFPEAPIVAGYLKPMLTSNDAVKARVPADWPTYFYLWYYGVLDYGVERGADGGTTYLVVKKSRYSIEDMADGRVTMLLDFGDMALYRAPGEDDD